LNVDTGRGQRFHGKEPSAQLSQEKVPPGFAHIPEDTKEHRSAQTG